MASDESVVIGFDGSNLTDVYVLTVQDTIVQIRDYAVLATSEDDAKRRIAEGYFLTEGTPETIDTLKTEFKAIAKVGERK